MQNENAGIHQRARKIVFPQPTSLRSLTSGCPGRSFPCFLTNPAALSSSAILLPSIWSWWNSLYKLFVIKFQNICPGLYNGPDRSTNSCFSQGVQGGEDGDEIH